MRDDLVLGCGCRAMDVDDAFMFEPCSDGCGIYAWVRDECERQGKPMIMLDLT